MTCGLPESQERPKRFLDGTHRIRTPEDTWSNIQGCLATCGVTRVAEVTALDTIGVPVFQAVRPASRNLSVSQGKGLTRSAARVSAVMEAIELWHVESLDGQPQAWASLRDMRDAQAISLSSLRWSSGVRCVDSAPIPWIPFRSLTSGRRAWVPRDMIELDDRTGRPLAPRPFDNTSSGLASGNCLDEALLHGICELVERHAIHLAHEDPRRRCALASHGLPEACGALIRRVRGAGMKLALYDVTWEAGLACVLARLAAPDLPNVWIGSGCHPAPDVAVSRAITEAAQSRLTYIAGSRDDLVELDPGEGAPALFDAFVEPNAQRSFRDLPDRSTSSVRSDLESVVALLDAIGLEPFFADLTRPDVGIPVTVSFVPGLREVHHA